MVIRYTGRKYALGDMLEYLIPWFDKIKQNGQIHGLNKQVGDYNILYQTIISLTTYLGDKSIYYYKIISIVFDFLLAFFTAIFASTMKKRKNSLNTFILTYTVMIMLPTVVFNSAFWGQCDSIYTCFIILTLFCLYNEKYRLAFFFFGVTFAFEFQTVFLLPFIICYYIYKKQFSIFYLAISIITFWSSGFQKISSF